MTCVARMAAHATKFTKETRKRKQQNPRHALKASLRQAGAQKRLTIGLSNCVNSLKRKPESIMVCLCLRSPTTSGKDKDEAVCNIQHMLLQAFCAESRILMVHVMADASLMRLVLQLAGRMGEMGASDDCSKEDLTDCSLVLIEFPAGPPSAEDMLWLSACEDGHLNIQTNGQLPSD